MWKLLCVNAVSLFVVTLYYDCHVTSKWSCALICEWGAGGAWADRGNKS